MIFNRKPTLFFFVVLVFAAFFLSSCKFFRNFYSDKKFLFANRTSVKNPPQDSTWFVFDNKINIKPGDISKDEQKRLESELPGYWDDTVKAKAVQQWGLFYRIKDPQQFDTIGLLRSQLFMKSYLQSQGYYNTTLSYRTDSAVFRAHRKPGSAFIGAVSGGLAGTVLAGITKNSTLLYGALGTVAGTGVGYLVGKRDSRIAPEFRVTSIMDITTGNRLKFDSVSYKLIDSNRNTPADSLMNRMAQSARERSLLRSGNYYSKQVIAAELDRLVELYRDSGYYRLNREHLGAYVDTIDVLIDDLTIDPFELARKAAEAAERRRKNPTADIQIMQASQIKDVPYDPAATKQYYIGNIYYYTDTALAPVPDSILAHNNFNTRQRGHVFMKYPTQRSPFNMGPIFQHNYLFKGRLYNEKQFTKTISTFTQMGPWQQVEWRDSIRQDTIDFHIFLERNKRYKSTYAFDLTRSTGDFIASTTLFGLGGNYSFLDRNFAHSAWQLSASVRAGIELNPEKGEELLQTMQFGTGFGFGVPKLLVTPFLRKITFAKNDLRQKRLDVARSGINFNASYTDRFEYFRLRSLTFNLLDEIQWRSRQSSNAKPGSAFALSYGPNLEFYSLDTLDRIRQAFTTNPFLRTAFNTGNVVGGIASFTWAMPVRTLSENSTLSNKLRFNVDGSFFPVAKSSFYRYIKVEGELTMKLDHPKTQKTQTVFRLFTGVGITTDKTMPFFKQFVAGGPSSMRAWGLRQLGLGSSQVSELATDFNDRFGDMHIELNLEHRVQLLDMGAAKLSTAFFIDAGNIWNLRADANNPLAQFKLNRFINDMALAGGIGLLRLNVANFIFRVDFAMKLRDPARRSNNGWLDFNNFTWKNENDKNNYAFQIGIGLPF